MRDDRACGRSHESRSMQSQAKLFSSTGCFESPSMTDLEESTECTRLCLFSSLANDNEEGEGGLSLDFITNERLIRPPFPFIHAIIRIFVKKSRGTFQPNETFAHGLYNESELDIKSIAKSRKDKIRFLFKMLVCVAKITGERVDLLVSPTKILSGQEVLSTHLFLRCLARASRVESEVSRRAVEEILQIGEGILYKKSVKARNGFIKLQATTRGNVTRKSMTLKKKDFGKETGEDNDKKITSTSHDGDKNGEIENSSSKEVSRRLKLMKLVEPISPDLSDGECGDTDASLGKVKKSQHSSYVVNLRSAGISHSENILSTKMANKSTQTSLGGGASRHSPQRRVKVAGIKSRSLTPRRERKGKIHSKVEKCEEKSFLDKTDGEDGASKTKKTGIIIDIPPTPDNIVGKYGTPKTTNCTVKTKAMTEVLLDANKSSREIEGTTTERKVIHGKMDINILAHTSESIGRGKLTEGDCNLKTAKKKLKKTRIINGVKTREEIDIGDEQKCEDQEKPKSHNSEVDILHLQSELKRRLRRMKEKEEKLDRRLEETEQRYEHLQVQEERCKKLAENLRKQQQRVKQEGIKQSIEMDKLRLQMPQNHGDRLEQKVESIHFTRDLHFGPELLQQASENATITDLRLSLERRERGLIKRQEKMAKAERKLRARIMELEEHALEIESHTRNTQVEKPTPVSSICRSKRKMKGKLSIISDRTESILGIDDNGDDIQSPNEKSSECLHLLPESSTASDEEVIANSPVSHVMIEAMDHNLTTITEESDEKQTPHSHQYSTLPKSLMDYTHRYIEAERQTFRMLERAKSF